MRTVQSSFCYITSLSIGSIEQLKRPKNNNKFTLVEKVLKIKSVYSCKPFYLQTEQNLQINDELCLSVFLSDTHTSINTLRSHSKTHISLPTTQCIRILITAAGKCNSTDSDLPFCQCKTCNDNHLNRSRPSWDECNLCLYAELSSRQHALVFIDDSLGH